MEGTRMMMMIAAVAVTVLLFIVPDVNAKLSDTKTIVVQNNHTSYLSIRCFSFNDAVPVKHLASNEEFRFRVKVKTFFPSATMYNCSTNMGTFVAFRHNYACSIHESNTCTWKFDEAMTYLFNPEANAWGPIDYNPNYESLSRGGVIRGYFVN